MGEAPKSAWNMGAAEVAEGIRDMASPQCGVLGSSRVLHGDPEHARGSGRGKGMMSDLMKFSDVRGIIPSERGPAGRTWPTGIAKVQVIL